MEEKQEKLLVKTSIFEKINLLFKDKKKRGLYLFLCILPFLVLICIFGIKTYKNAKTIIDLATGTVEENDEYRISSMDYILRDNATDLQFEYFTELKQAVEVDGADDITLASLVAKNYIADFYTWTNKQGQYDVGGLYYVCDSKTDTIKYKTNFYTKARDGFYKYFNYYANKYGTANLIEVDNVEVVSCKELGYPYSIYELAEAILLEDGDLERIYDNVDHEAYYLKVRWSYKPETKLNLNDFATSIDMIIMKDGNRFEIVELSENEIDARQLEDESVEDE